MMVYNQDVLLKNGQRWKYDGAFIGEIQSFTDRDNVKLKVVQSLNSAYPVGTVVIFTMNDRSLSLLEGQERP